MRLPLKNFLSMRGLSKSAPEMTPFFLPYLRRIRFIHLRYSRELFIGKPYHRNQVFAMREGASVLAVNPLNQFLTSRRGFARQLVCRPPCRSVRIVVTDELHAVPQLPTTARPASLAHKEVHSGWSRVVTRLSLRYAFRSEPR